MKVIARTGVRVPMEKKPRAYIDDTTPVDIELTTYYARRLHIDKDLVVYTEPSASTASDKTAAKGA